MRHSSKTIRGIICTLTGAVAWGFSGACGQLLTQNAGISAMYVTLLRMIFAGITLTLVNIVRNKKQAFEVFKNRRTCVLLILFAVLGLLLSQLAYLRQYLIQMQELQQFCSILDLCLS